MPNLGVQGEIEMLAKATPHIYRVRIPVPNPLKSVNCYICRSDAGWHIIDTGYHTETARTVWMETFKTLRISFTDVVEIVLTHFHPDHSGMAGVLQQWTGAPVKISTIDFNIIQSIWAVPLEMDMFDELAKEHGMPEEWRRLIRQQGEEDLGKVYPLPQFTPFEQGETFSWSKTFVAIHAPGHADGHMIFYSPDLRTVLCGDVLLPRVTPNIGYFPKMDPNPLASFFETLQKIEEYPLETVLPGHGDAYVDGNRRARQLAEHHRRRLKEIMDVIVEPLSAFQISLAVFSHIRDGGSAQQHRFAFQETLAHLIYLEQKGEVVREKHVNGYYTFSRKGE